MNLKRIIGAIFVAIMLIATPLWAAEKIDINTASATQLTQISGIGEKIASNIIAYRDEHGPFKSIQELLHVKGIGEKRLAKIHAVVEVEVQASEGSASSEHKDESGH